MSNTKKETKTLSLDKLQLSNKPKLLLTKKVADQIDYLHKKCGEVEWSGELITSEKGTLNDLDEWQIIAEDIYLVDIGVKAYTEYEVDKGGFKAADIVDMYEKFPDLETGKLKNHHIHSHNSFGTFFSSTDWEQLNDRSLVSNYFLMLIVNFEGKYCAKVAFKAKQGGKKNILLELSNNIDNYSPIKLVDSREKEMLVVMDCDIIYPERDTLIDDAFTERFAAVKKAIAEEKEKSKSSTYATPAYNGYNRNEVKQGSLDNYWNDDKDSYRKGNYNAADYYLEGGVWKKKETKISRMSDKEFKNHNSDKLVFELRHARMFLNNLIDSKDANPYNFADCINLLKSKESTLKKKADRDDFLQEIEYGMGAKFDELFPYKPDEIYLDLLQVTYDYLSPYAQQIPIVKDIIQLIEIEMLTLNSKGVI
jgi:hypothetical protein